MAAAEGAWDINELAYSAPEIDAILRTDGYSNPLPRGDGSTCKFTVAINGKCYHANQVTYAMWGKMFKLCGSDFNRNVFGVSLPYSKATAVAGAAAWKQSRYGQGPDNIYVQQAVDFTGYGYDGTLSGRNTTIGCKVTGAKYTGKFTWTWEPNQPRW